MISIQEQKIREFISPLFIFPSIKYDLVPNDEDHTFELIVSTDMEGMKTKKSHFILKNQGRNEVELLKGEDFSEVTQIELAMCMFIEELFN